MAAPADRCQLATFGGYRFASGLGRSGEDAAACQRSSGPAPANAAGQLPEARAETVIPRMASVARAAAVRSFRLAAARRAASVRYGGGGNPGIW